MLQYELTLEKNSLNFKNLDKGNLVYNEEK